MESAQYYKSLEKIHLTQFSLIVKSHVHFVLTRSLSNTCKSASSSVFFLKRLSFLIVPPLTMLFCFFNSSVFFQIVACAALDFTFYLYNLLLVVLLCKDLILFLGIAPGSLSGISTFL